MQIVYRLGICYCTTTTTPNTQHQASANQASDTKRLEQVYNIKRHYLLLIWFDAVKKAANNAVCASTPPRVGGSQQPCHRLFEALRPAVRGTVDHDTAKTYRKASRSMRTDGWLRDLRLFLRNRKTHKHQQNRGRHNQQCAIEKDTTSLVGRYRWLQGRSTLGIRLARFSFTDTYVHL